MKTVQGLIYIVPYLILKFLVGDQLVCSTHILIIVDMANKERTDTRLSCRLIYSSVIPPSFASYSIKGYNTTHSIRFHLAWTYTAPKKRALVLDTAVFHFLDA
jgi:preprotein translocase subunit SecY